MLLFLVFSSLSGDPQSQLSPKAPVRLGRQKVGGKGAHMGDHPKWLGPRYMRWGAAPTCGVVSSEEAALMRGAVDVLLKLGFVCSMMSLRSAQRPDGQPPVPRNSTVTEIQLHTRESILSYPSMDL